MSGTQKAVPSDMIKRAIFNPPPEPSQNAEMFSAHDVHSPLQRALDNMTVRAHRKPELGRRGALGRRSTGSSVSTGICCGCLPLQDVHQDEDVEDEEEEEEAPVHVHLEAISEEVDESFTAEER